MAGLIGFAAVALVAWFAAGTIWNVRSARSLMRWMQAGLSCVGRRTTVRWLGSTAVEMVLSEVKPPFSAATLVIFLEPRDLPWWPISRARGRRDTLILRAVLERAPVLELEALDPASWSGREALPRVPREWRSRQGSLVVHHEDARALQRADALLAVARDAGMRMVRLSVRRSEPYLQLHIAFPEPVRSARAFFEAVHGLSELALK